MHSYYLREMYLHNNLIKRDKLTIAGEAIDLDRIVQPLYAVTAEDDHIAPWKQCYRIRKYVNIKASVRFVLSTSGHILGIVNPPANPPKRSYWIAEPDRNEHWEHWFDRAEKKPGTWWEDWTRWVSVQAIWLRPIRLPTASSPPSLMRREPTFWKNRPSMPLSAHARN
jgi:polyhydroxyalkanoate synthase